MVCVEIAISSWRADLLIVRAWLNTLDRGCLKVSASTYIAVEEVSCYQAPF